MPALQQKLTALSNLYSRVDGCAKDTEQENLLLKSVAQQSYDFCTPEGRTIEDTVASYGFNDPKILENKHIRQMNKLGRYWGLCGDLTEASRKYRALFESVKLRPIPRYEEFNAPISTKVRWIPCFVHAEIQLLTFYGLQSSPDVKNPRVLGVSKAACYLCNLFIVNHRRFFITKTHGRLYPLWNVPDVAEYDQTQLFEIRRVLVAMNKDIQKALVKPQMQRYWPTESFVHLRGPFLTSPVASDLGTLPSVASTPPKVISPGSLVDHPASTGTTPVLVSNMKAPNREGNNGEDTKWKDTQEASRSPSVVPTRELHSSITLHEAHSPDVKTVATESSSPAVPLESSDHAPLLGSCNNDASCECPVQRIVTASRPSHAEVDNFSLIFEVEGSSRGTYEIMKISDSDSEEEINLVDIRAMKPGEERKISRAKEDPMVLNLRHSRDHPLRVTLQWK